MNKRFANEPLLWMQCIVGDNKMPEGHEYMSIGIEYCHQTKKGARMIPVSLGRYLCQQ